jgi:uncharacterized membrane protein YhhN
MFIWIVMVLFAFSTIGILVAEINDEQRLRYIAKPLLMPLLAVFYYLNAYQVSPLIITALVFSFIGDVCLLWNQKKLLFAAGLFAFFVTQLMYSIYLGSNIDWLLLQPAVVYGGIAAYIVLGGVVYGLLFRHLNGMKIPVLVYILGLLFMSFLCLLNMSQNEGVAGWMPFIGSLFFILSDSMLAFHSFKAKISRGGVYIMASYLFAQILIICGFILS